MSEGENVASETPEKHLDVRGLSITFGGLKAVRDVSFSANSGSVTAVIGPNGAGKSTLLNMISGFLTPDSGTVVLKGEDITKLSPWTRVARGMSRTFQNLEVFEGLTVGENVALGIPTPIGSSILGPLFRWKAYAAEQQMVKTKARALLERVGLRDRADELAKNLSYGDQKLLIIARLLATECDLLLFDEPGAGLPREEIESIGRIFTSLADSGKTVLLVDHNMRLIFGYSDYVYVLHHGELVAQGTSKEVQNHPEVIEIYLTGGGTGKAA